jgi:hypothetical protein
MTRAITAAKNPAAVALGRLGGAANTPAQRKHRAGQARNAARARWARAKRKAPVTQPA